MSEAPRPPSRAWLWSDPRASAVRQFILLGVAGRLLAGGRGGVTTISYPKTASAAGVRGSEGGHSIFNAVMSLAADASIPAGGGARRFLFMRGGRGWAAAAAGEWPSFISGLVMSRVPPASGPRSLTVDEGLVDLLSRLGAVTEMYPKADGYWRRRALAVAEAGLGVLLEFPGYPNGVTRVLIKAPPGETLERLISLGSSLVLEGAP